MENSQPQEEGGQLQSDLNNSGNFPVFNEIATSCKLQIGTRVGDIVLAKMYNAKKSIKIISPFLSPVMIDHLCDIYLMGMHNIYLITMASDPHLDHIRIEVLKKLIRRIHAEPELQYKAVLNTTFFKKEKESVFIHEKLYIIDDETAYAGSFNFTRRGCLITLKQGLLLRPLKTCKS